MMERIKQIDNIKGSLIFLVVWGHFIERFYSQNNIYNWFIHDFIYSFHMPIFILITGLFTYQILNKVNIKKILASVLIPLLVFQLITNIFLEIGNNKFFLHVLHSYSNFKPIIMLWFLMSLLWWRLLTPYLLKLKFPLIVSLLLCFISNLLLINVDEHSSQVLAIMRTVNFLPFFVIGAKYKVQILKLFKSNFNTLIYIICFITLITLPILIIKMYPESIRAFYGDVSFSYLNLNYFKGIYQRLLLDVLALISGFNFCYLVRNFNFLNKFGKNSLYIYLWHGVIYMFLKNIGGVSINTNKYMIVAIVFTKVRGINNIGIRG